jgi:ABC-2 type transport system permease protein
MNRFVTGNRYSKFLLYLVVVVLVNLAASTLFFRIDLTKNRLYSLSPASKKVVSTLSEPLTIKVFFTSHLPAPYNNIERYLHDLLQEYSIAGNHYFNYQFYNISDEGNEEARQNRELAASYGISPVQIQNIEQDQVKFQMAHMGMALIHGDLVETLPAILSTEGLEYKITSTIRKMNNKISALLNLKNKIAVKLFLSSSLEAVGPYMNLPGLSELPDKIENVVQKLNEKNYGKLAFTPMDPSRNPSAEAEAERYHILPLQWDEFTDRMGKTIPANKGFAGIIVEGRGKTEQIPLLHIFRIPIFGTQYQLAEMDELREGINDAVENVININEEIGYLADHGTPSLATSPLPGQQPAESLSDFQKLLSEEYSVKSVHLQNGSIPEGLPTLIIAGPRKPFTDHELYQIDQYLMKGRNLAIFLDPFDDTMAAHQSSMMRGQGPLYMPLNTGLEKLLSHYGLNLQQAYVLDESCYKQKVPRAFGGGERKIYYAPIIKNEWINKKAPFMENIKGLVMLKASPLSIDSETIKKEGLHVERLFSSSKKSWEMSGNINLNPLLLQPPKDESEYKQMAMAYLVQGPFSSYFADKPIPEKQKEAENNGAVSSNKEESGVDMSRIRSQGATIKKGKPGRIFLIGTSEVVKDNILGDNGNSPNSQFIMNVLDALNGRTDYAVMRSKTQRFNPLGEIRPEVKIVIKAANIVGLPILVILAGLTVWFRRASRKRFIQQMFK